jgi:NAD(P) transhydrogenase subunit alpha
VSDEFLKKQREIVARHVAAADAVITTAMVPGKPAPKLVSTAMVESMRPGSVIVDLAVDAGGNCELSEKDKEVIHKDVKILGPGNLAATLSSDASTLYARNIQTLLLSMMKEGEFQVDLEDEVVAGSLLTHEGKVIHAPTASLLEG